MISDQKMFIKKILNNIVKRYFKRCFAFQMKILSVQKKVSLLKSKRNMVNFFAFMLWLSLMKNISHIHVILGQENYEKYINP